MKTTAKTPARLRRPSPQRILIVNGMTPVREVVAKWINRCPDLRVCGEAFGEKTGLEMIRRFHPNLVLSEIMHPQDLGFIRELHRLHRRLPILAYSFRDEEAYALRALAAGARGYLMKNVNGNTLVAGIRKVLNGRVVLSPVMARRLCRRGHSAFAVRAVRKHFTKVVQPKAERRSAGNRLCRRAGKV